LVIQVKAPGTMQNFLRGNPQEVGVLAND